MRDEVLDDVDRRILDALQHDARISAEQLGLASFVSASTAHRRAQRLRDNGTIMAEVAIVDAKAVGRPLVFIVGLVLEREDSPSLHQLRSWLGSEPSVQMAWYVTGEADFRLVVTARDVEEYDDMTSRLLKENPMVRGFTTSVVLSTVKRTLTVPAGP